MAQNHASTSSCAAHARALHAAGLTLESLGRFEEALWVHRRALRRWMEAGELAGEAGTCGDIGVTLLGGGNAEEATVLGPGNREDATASCRHQLELACSPKDRTDDDEGDALAQPGVGVELLGLTEEAFEAELSYLRIAAEIGDMPGFVSVATQPSASRPHDLPSDSPRSSTHGFSTAHQAPVSSTSIHRSRRQLPVLRSAWQRRLACMPRRRSSRPLEQASWRASRSAALSPIGASSENSPRSGAPPPEESRSLPEEAVLLGAAFDVPPPPEELCSALAAAPRQRGIFGGRRRNGELDDIAPPSAEVSLHAALEPVPESEPLRSDPWSLRAREAETWSAKDIQETNGDEPPIAATWGGA